MNCKTILIAISLIILSSPLYGSSDRLSVFVTIPPQAYFVERIGGDLVDIHILVHPGSAPETYDPTPQQLTALSESDILFAIGMPFESRVIEKLRDSMKNLKIILPPSPGDHGEHEHTADDTSCSSCADLHTWVDPLQAADMAHRMCDELCQLSPANDSIFRSNFAHLQHDLDSVHLQIDSLLAPLRGRSFYIYHPALNHFANRYGLLQVAIEKDGKDPHPRQLQHRIEAAAKSRVNIVFVEPSHPTKSAATFAEAIGAEVVTIDPLSRDYLTNLIDMAQKIRTALSTTDAP